MIMDEIKLMQQMILTHSHLSIVLAGFLLDMLFGDPLGRIHPVRLIGWVIKTYEQAVYRRTDTPRQKRQKGTQLVLMTILFTASVCVGLLNTAYRMNRWLGWLVEVVMAWSILSAHDLKKESMRVCQALLSEEDASHDRAKQALSMIVGRDVTELDAEGIAKAAVETVAENTSDGEIAPLFYMMLGGPLLGMIYKAVNTLDSMVGYQNKRYVDFGRTAAKTDDVVNFLPSRIAGVLTVAAAAILKEDAKGAWRIFLRDRNRHESPNAGQTESAFAGALGIQLGGAASYFGRIREKPVMGDALRPIEPKDIVRANRLQYVIAWLALVGAVCVIALMGVWFG